MPPTPSHPACVEELVDVHPAKKQRKKGFRESCRAVIEKLKARLPWAKKPERLPRGAFTPAADNIQQQQTQPPVAALTVGTNSPLAQQRQLPDAGTTETINRHRAPFPIPIPEYARGPLPELPVVAQQRNPAPSSLTHNRPQHGPYRFGERRESLAQPAPIVNQSQQPLDRFYNSRGEVLPSIRTFDHHYQHPFVPPEDTSVHEACVQYLLDVFCQYQAPCQSYSSRIEYYPTSNQQVDYNSRRPSNSPENIFKAQRRRPPSLQWSDAGLDAKPSPEDLGSYTKVKMSFAKTAADRDNALRYLPAGDIAKPLLPKDLIFGVSDKLKRMSLLMDELSRTVQMQNTLNRDQIIESILKDAIVLIADPAADAGTREEMRRSFLDSVKPHMDELNGCLATAMAENLIYARDDAEKIKTIMILGTETGAIAHPLATIKELEKRKASQDRTDALINAFQMAIALAIRDSGQRTALIEFGNAHDEMRSLLLSALCEMVTSLNYDAVDIGALAKDLAFSFQSNSNSSVESAASFVKEFWFQSLKKLLKESEPSGVEVTCVDIWMLQIAMRDSLKDRKVEKALILEMDTFLRRRHIDIFDKLMLHRLQVDDF